MLILFVLFSLYLFNLRRFLTQQFQQVNIIILNVILTTTQKAMQYRIYFIEITVSSGKRTSNKWTTNKTRQTNVWFSAWDMAKQWRENMKHDGSLLSGRAAASPRSQLFGLDHQLRVWRPVWENWVYDWKEVIKPEFNMHVYSVANCSFCIISIWKSNLTERKAK